LKTQQRLATEDPSGTIWQDENGMSKTSSSGTTRHQIGTESKHTPPGRSTRWISAIT